MDCLVPEERKDALAALNKLLILRDAWYKIIDWKPDWEKPDEKYCVTCKGYEISEQKKTFEHAILAFPTKRIRSRFMACFGDLIEEAKTLL